MTDLTNNITNFIKKAMIGYDGVYISINTLADIFCVSTRSINNSCREIYNANDLSWITVGNNLRIYINNNIDLDDIDNISNLKVNMFI